MKARYVQRGESIDYIPQKPVSAGDIVKLGKLVGVAKLDIAVGELGALALVGVYEIETGGLAIGPGEVVSVDPRAVCEMLDAGIIPVVTPLATGVDDSHLYNVNADLAAAALAKELKVRKFALVSDVPGLLRDPADPKTLLSTLHLKSVEALKAEGVISGGMLPKIESCEDAIRAGVKKVHLVDGRMAHSLLLEIFTREGVGTEITE